MYYIARQQINTAKTIARSAQQLIKDQTGMSVKLVAYRTESTINSPEHMLGIIAEALNMSVVTYKMRSRLRDITELRFIGALLLKENFPTITLCQIAAFFGGQDHSSIINGIARAQNLIYSRDERFLAKYTNALKSVNKWRRAEA